MAASAAARACGGSTQIPRSDTLKLPDVDGVVPLLPHGLLPSGSSFISFLGQEEEGAEEWEGCGWSVWVLGS